MTEKQFKGILKKCEEYAKDSYEVAILLSHNKDRPHIYEIDVHGEKYEEFKDKIGQTVELKIHECDHCGLITIESFKVHVCEKDEWLYLYPRTEKEWKEFEEDITARIDSVEYGKQEIGQEIHLQEFTVELKNLKGRDRERRFNEAIRNNEYAQGDLMILRQHGVLRLSMKNHQRRLDTLKELLEKVPKREGLV